MNSEHSWYLINLPSSASTNIVGVTESTATICPSPQHCTANPATMSINRIAILRMKCPCVRQKLLMLCGCDVQGFTNLFPVEKKICYRFW